MALPTDFVIPDLPASPVPRSLDHMQFESNLNKSDAREKVLGKLSKEQKSAEANTSDHPLQIAKALGDYFHDQVPQDYYKYLGKEGYWTRCQLITRRHHFIKDRFLDFYTGTDVLFNERLLVLLVGHYAHCENRYGGLLLGPNRQRFQSVVLLQPIKNNVPDKKWTVPKGCRNIYKFQNNSSTYNNEDLSVDQRLVPVGTVEEDIDAGLREVQEETGIIAGQLKTYVQGYITIENFLSIVKLFVFIIPKDRYGLFELFPVANNGNGAGWQQNETHTSQWISLDLKNKNHKCLAIKKEGNSATSGLFNQCNFFVHNKKIQWKSAETPIEERIVWNFNLETRERYTHQSGLIHSRNPQNHQYQHYQYQKNFPRFPARKPLNYGGGFRGRARDIRLYPTPPGVNEQSSCGQQGGSGGRARPGGPDLRPPVNTSQQPPSVSPYYYSTRPENSGRGCNNTNNSIRRRSSGRGSQLPSGFTASNDLPVTEDRTGLPCYSTPHRDSGGRLPAGFNLLSPLYNINNTNNQIESQYPSPGGTTVPNSSQFRNSFARPRLSDAAQQQGCQNLSTFGQVAHRAPIHHRPGHHNQPSYRRTHENTPVRPTYQTNLLERQSDVHDKD